MFWKYHLGYEALCASKDDSTTQPEPEISQTLVTF